MKIAILFTLVVATAFPQPAPPPKPGSISGTVTDGDTAAPLANVEVFIRAGAKQIQATTDSAGRYTLRPVDPGSFTVLVIAPTPGRGGGPQAARFVTLAAGQDLAKIDIAVQRPAQISGIVTDENDEPVPGITVFLIARHYELGAIRYIYASNNETDDQGAYTIQVEPGRGFLVLAAKRNYRLDPLSEAPADPQLRRRAIVPTYYPGSSTIDGAQAIVLRSGERREAVNLRVLRSPSFCIEGRIDNTPQTRFAITEKHPTSGRWGDRATYMLMPGGVPAADGRIRICNLAPGDYILSASQSAPDGRTAVGFGATPVTITKEDITRISAATLPRIPLTGQVMWDGQPPEPPLTAQILVTFSPMTQTGGPVARVSIPGEFSIDALVDDHAVVARNLPTGVYVKAIQYGNHDLRFQPFRPGSAVGDNSVRVVLARDGGTVKVTVADKDGNPLADRHVALLPLSATSEPMLADALISGRTDQNGAWTSAMIAPGKYYAVVNPGTIDKSPETISRLWRARSQAELIDLAPNGSVSATLIPKSLD